MSSLCFVSYVFMPFNGWAAEDLAAVEPELSCNCFVCCSAGTEATRLLRDHANTVQVQVGGVSLIGCAARSQQPGQMHRMGCSHDDAGPSSSDPSEWSTQSHLNACLIAALTFDFAGWPRKDPAAAVKPELPGR